jgi:predicted AAA+ superfamily ATPase
MAKEYRRWQIERTRRSLKNRRVVAISGARQTGKTTLTKQVMKGKGNYRSLDKAVYLKAAQDDPEEFVKNAKGTLVIDEVQLVPVLMNEIKLSVDNDNRCGQYLLTGSANIQTIATISDSLAGRIKHIRLRPLTMGEILGRKPKFLECAFAGDFPTQIKGYDKDTILDLAFRGGYPEVLRLKDVNERREWHNEYIDNIIRKDLNDIENIRRYDVVQDLIKILFGWSSNYIDKTKIGSKLEISKPTFDAYFNALVALFIFERVPPWIRTDYELIKKKSKLFATDTGLMTTLLEWKREDLSLNPDKAGKLMETFVFQELAAQIDLDMDYSLHQYRDKQKREIDFLVKKAGESLIGIEVKASRMVSGDDFKSLIWFRNNVVKGSMPFKSYVLYTGDSNLSFGDGRRAIPIAALWMK